MALPMKKMAKKMSRKGRMGDDRLIHVNRREEALLKKLGGVGTKNPHTGLREYYADSDPAGSDPGSGMGGGDSLGSDAGSAPAGDGPSDPDREGLGGGPGAPQSGAVEASPSDLGYSFNEQAGQYATDLLGPQASTLSRMALAGPFSPIAGLVERARDALEAKGFNVSDDHSIGPSQDRGDTGAGGGFAGNDRADPGSPNASGPAVAAEALRNSLRFFQDFFGNPNQYAYGQEHNFFPTFADGGLIQGPGTDTSDSIPAVINGSQPAALSNNEFVLPADVVRSLGKGSPERGGMRLKQLIKMIRDMEAAGVTDGMQGGLRALVNSK